MKELKIRVDGSLEKWLERLNKLGSQQKDVAVEDIYFETSSLDVLKITRRSEGDFLVRFKHENGNFLTQPTEKVSNFKEKFIELDEKYGTKKILKRHQVVFGLVDGTIEIDAIEGLGNFLVLVQENPHIDWFDKNLGLKNPEQIVVPFSDL